MTETPAWTHTHADSMRNHWWWRPGWRVGRRFYTWHLTFAEQHDLHRLVDHYQSKLARIPGLDPVPRRCLHLTMQAIGFVDETNTDDVTAIIEQARGYLASIPQPELTFQRCVVRHEAVALPPAPIAAVTRIRDGIRRGIADVWGEDHVPERAEGYQPHVSLAYSSAEGSATPVVDAVDQADVRPATASISHASLIELNRDQRMYQWRTVDTVALGRRARSSQRTA